MTSGQHADRGNLVLKRLTAGLLAALAIGSTTLEHQARAADALRPQASPHARLVYTAAGELYRLGQSGEPAMPVHHAVAAAQPAHTTGATLPVTSCDDDGSAGTLRSVIGSAVSGDIVDLSALSCSTITLGSDGAILINQDDLTLHGPTDATLVIDGNGARNSVLAHYGTGALSIDHLTITGGASIATGGGVYSASNVTLDHVVVTGNSAYLQGGGALAIGLLTLKSSTLSDNRITKYADAYNSACASLCMGGGAMAGSLVVENSTISGNGATRGGGLRAQTETSISNSTVSGNSALGQGGGLAMGGTVNLRNTTIAFNTAGLAGGGFMTQGEIPPELHSTILASNSVAEPGMAADVGTFSADLSLSLIGSHNLIGASDIAVPADTLAFDPLLQPLADNGGPTWTHALGDGSPALDAGSNPDALAFDQRGDGFARSAGAATDIGAFERQAQDDTIFADGFEPAPVVHRP